MMMLSRFEGHVRSGLDKLNDTLLNITKAAGVEVLPLDDAALRMSVELHFTEVVLSELDRAVLATVLTKGRSLRDSGETDVTFCDLDSDFWPWEKGAKGIRRPRAELKKLYDNAGVWVYSDFTLTSPERPEGSLDRPPQVNDIFPCATEGFLLQLPQRILGGKLSRGTSGHVFSLNVSGLLVQGAWDLTTIICRASAAIN